MLPELFGLFLEHVLDGRIMQKVHQIVDLMRDELEELLHHRSHNSHSMRPDTIQHLVHSNSLDLLCLACPLYERLRV